MKLWRHIFLVKKCTTAKATRHGICSVLVRLIEKIKKCRKHLTENDEFKIRENSSMQAKEITSQLCRPSCFLFEPTVVQDFNLKLQNVWNFSIAIPLIKRMINQDKGSGLHQITNNGETTKIVPSKYIPIRSP